MVAIRGAREVDNTTQFKLFTRSDFLEALARERNNCGSFKIRYAVSPTSYEIFKNTLAREHISLHPPRFNLINFQGGSKQLFP